MSGDVFVALAGNPNSGKTTLFNALTGLRYKVANYPGVTVEKREGEFILDEFGRITLLDLPGIYSLSALSQDERIATNVLITTGRPPDAVVAVVDATNIERNLYLVSQLIDCGVPLVIALNMSDLAEKKGIRINKEILRRELDVGVVSIVANRHEGFHELARELRALLKKPVCSARAFLWGRNEPSYLEAAEKLGGEYIERHPSRAPKQFLGASLLSETISSPELSTEIARARSALAPLDSYSHETTSRYRWLNSIVQRSCVHPTGPREHRFDRIATDRIWGTLIFALVMFFMFQSIFLFAHAPMDFIDTAFSRLGTWLTTKIPKGEIQSLVVDGVVAGVGSVVVFVPQIALLMLFLGILEDSGYLSRAAYLMDRVLRPFGLQGRSFIPLLSSFACAIPGILATRTIPSWADRITTIMIAPLMSCSARLPVYAVLIGAFVPETFYLGFISLQGLVLLAMYFLGVVAACGVAWALKHSLLHGKPALFVMEMPPFRLPSPRVVLTEALSSVGAFLKNAGTMILACSIVLWFLASHPKPADSNTPHSVRESYAGEAGQLIEPLIAPLGFNWEIGVGIIASFAAREVFVSSLATVYNLEGSEDSSGSLTSLLREKRERGSFTTLTAISLMVFYVFACQCMSTLAVTLRETGSYAWMVFMFSYMTALAYAAAFSVQQLGRIFGYG